MDNHLSALKITLIIEMMIGLVFTSFLAFILGAFAMDSPTATHANFAMALCLDSLPLARPHCCCLMLQ
jgi:hypothetical protein